MIKHLYIKNFKSIKELSFETKKINLLVGFPNVGKSNILEALSFHSTLQPAKYFMEGFIRYFDVENLFFENNSSKSIIVASDQKVSILTNEKDRYGFFKYYLLEDERGIKYFANSKSGNDIDQEHLNDFINRSKLIVSNDNGDSNTYLVDEEGGIFENTTREFDLKTLLPIHLKDSIKKYNFRVNNNYGIRFNEYLLPPFGENLYDILENNDQLFEIVRNLLLPYGLELVLWVKDRRLEILKRKGVKVYGYPYNSIADTLQRLTFFLAAILSNRDSVLLFEEPEAHSFPPFVQMLASKIAADETNQYFITTHSPYIFDTLLEHVPQEDLAVHVCSYQDHQTKLKTLSTEDLQSIGDMREEIFFNLEKYS
jgi:AAA15 family ATPase/GTPase